MSFLEKRKQQLGIKSLGDQIRAGEINQEVDETLFINGPSYMDCLVEKWCRKEMMTIVGGSGAGKTEITLEILESILKNNDDPNGIVIFVSLEMVTDKIAKRWLKKVGKGSELSDRLFVVSNFDETGKSKMMTTEDVYREVSKIKEALGVNVLATVVDHLHIITPAKGQGDDLNKVAWRARELAVSLDTFLIMLAQTTKGKSGQFNDKPLDKDSVYGVSQLTWASAFMITIHKPLGMLGKSGMNALAWGYVKVREQHDDDPLSVGIFNILKYDMKTSSLKEPSRDDMLIFSNQYAQVLDMRKELEDDEGESAHALYNTKVDGKAISDREKLIATPLYKDDL